MNQWRLHFIAGSNIFHKLFFRPGIPLLKLLFTFFFSELLLAAQTILFLPQVLLIPWNICCFIWFLTVCVGLYQKYCVCMSNVRAKLSCRSFKSFLSTMLCNQSQTVSWQCQLPDSISAHFLFIWLICLTCTVAVQVSLCYSTLTGKQPVTVKHKHRYTEAFHVSVRHFSVDISECFRRHARRREKWETVRERPEMNCFTLQQHNRTFTLWMLVRLMSRTVFWPGLSVCQGCSMSLSWYCNSSEECQFTFQECHFITFIFTLLSSCQTSQGSVQFKCPILTQKSHTSRSAHIPLCLHFCFSCVCHKIIVIVSE